MNIHIPEEVRYLLKVLDDNGFNGFIVGGCVRDFLLNVKVEDWDITTNALPENIISIFKGNRIITTGLKHGTITVVVNKKHFEITTFRVDGEYSDNRRPDTVKYVNNLKDDLSRRDFTINAMAYNEKSGLIDIFHGEQDLNNHIIRCVGDADSRFREDALRMLRAVRFSAKLGFDIHMLTQNAICKNASLIKNISKERIREELNKILLSDYPDRIYLLISNRLMSYIIPEFLRCIGLPQRQHCNNNDVGEHIIKTVGYAERKLIFKLTMLLHDIGKPYCEHIYSDSVDSYPGHEVISSQIAGEVLNRLKYDKKTIEKVKKLIFYHETEIDTTPKTIREWLSKLGEEDLRDLLIIKKYDLMGQGFKCYDEKYNKLERSQKILEGIVDSGECFSREGLEINGEDLISLGYKEGQDIGKIIDRLLKMVIEDPSINTKEKLLSILISDKP